MKTIVLYKSKYGSSKQYAKWLAEALQCAAVRVEDAPMDEVVSYDVVLYVGGIYAGGVNGFKQFAKHLDALRNKKLLLCMVGMTNPAEQAKYQQFFMHNVPEPYRDSVKPFALRGDQLFSKMNFIHRVMMNMPKAMTEKIPVEQRTADDQYFLAHFGEDIHYAKQENIREIVEYVNKKT